MTQLTNHYLSWIDSDNELHCELLQKTKDSFTIGRSDITDIEVLNTSVSRKHVVLTWAREKLYIKDLS